MIQEVQFEKHSRELNVKHRVDPVKLLLHHPVKCRNVLMQHFSQLVQQVKIHTLRRFCLVVVVSIKAVTSSVRQGGSDGSRRFLLSDVSLSAC